MVVYDDFISLVVVCCCFYSDDDDVDDDDDDDDDMINTIYLVGERGSFSLRTNNEY